MNNRLPSRIRDAAALLPVLLLDAAIVAASYAAALALRFDGDVPGASVRFFAQAAPFIVAAHLVANFLFRIYRTSWKYAGMLDAVNIAVSIGAVSVLLFGINVFLNPRHIPLTVNVVAPALMVLAMGAVKFWPRLWASRNPFGGYDAGVKNVLIVGAGHTGQLLAREFLQNRRWQYRPVGFVDDDRRLRGVRIHSVTVLGDRHDIPLICERRRVDLVALAIPSAGGKVVRDIVGIVQSAGVQVRTVPALRALVHGQAHGVQLREVTVDDLLGRAQVEIDAEMCAAALRGKPVLITGAGLFALPPLDAMRHPYTFAAVATFLLAVVAALGWASLDLSKRRRAGFSVVALALLETAGPGIVVREAPRGLPPVYERLLTLPPGAALDVPVLDADTLLWAARHGRPVVNGAGAFTPLYTATLHRQVRNHWLRRTPTDVDASKPAEFLRRAFDARYVILPTGRRHGLWALAFAFDRSRGFRLVAEVEDGDRIYEVVR